MLAVPVSLPANLVENVRSDPDPVRRAWLEGLPDVVEDLAQQWDLVIGAPFQPGGNTAWVAPARDAVGRELVLKVGWRHDEARDEAAGLRIWNGAGTVQVYRSAETDRTSALLLERCRPGQTLASTVPDEEQDVVIASLLTRLWPAEVAGHPFRPLAEMCQAWLAERAERVISAPAGPQPLDPGLERAGLELFALLPRTADRQVLLCTDLHAGNVLSARREPWLVIDPKPYSGDPAYDVLQHLLNHVERLHRDPSGLARRMADLAGLDAERVCLWLFARCVQESLDEPELAAIAARLAPP
jgi:streptomycin 6-kinase